MVTNESCTIRIIVERKLFREIAQFDVGLVSVTR